MDEVRGKTYQVPKSNHPWRRYANRINKDEEEEVKIRTKSVKEMKAFIQDLAEGWDNIEIYTTAYGKEDKFKLSTLPQSKQAAWLVSILKRNYSQL